MNLLDLKNKYNLQITGIIHVGAHVGQELSIYRDMSIENIVCFEPLREAFERLQNTVTNQYSDQSITCYQYALGSKEDYQVPMHISDNDKMSSSILEPQLHLDQYPTINFIDIEYIDVKTLDSFNFSHVYNTLNIDVQGYELEVLKGSINTLSRINYIYCEVNQEQLYRNNATVNDIDLFLSRFNFKRIETDWCGETWGEALYVKQQDNTSHALVNRFALDTENPNHNFDLAYYYHSIGHTASAFSHYLRCAERTDDKDFTYECLIRSFYCFDSQSNRDFTSKHLLMDAISLCPHRPEAYYILSQFYLQKNDPYNAYMLTCIGLQLCDFNVKPLITYVGYNDKYDLLYNKALAGWHWEKLDEYKDILNYIIENKHLVTDQNKPSLAFDLVQDFEKQQQIHTIYDKSKYNKFKYKFDGLKNIEKNYSQCYQDLFILALTNGLRNGFYLEIGAGDPFIGSNTALLEKSFDWKGVSIELDSNKVESFKQHRSNKILCEDATSVDYKKVLADLCSISQTNVIDYLQLDCEPPKVTFETLLQIPFDIYKFKIITYEHDYCVDFTKSYREKSRRYLSSLGYELLVNNISANTDSPFEDWWIYPNYFSVDTINLMKSIREDTQQAEKYILSQ